LKQIQDNLSLAEGKISIFSPVAAYAPFPRIHSRCRKAAGIAADLPKEWLPILFFDNIEQRSKSNLGVHMKKNIRAQVLVLPIIVAISFLYSSRLCPASDSYMSLRDQINRELSGNDSELREKNTF
jgi:hypothetical protein